MVRRMIVRRMRGMARAAAGLHGTRTKRAAPGEQLYERSGAKRGRIVRVGASRFLRWKG
jgi:hypothetical protein